MDSEVEHCDVLVIGGGPAGSTVSALLSEKGWWVTLLEKDRRPRFHIGESLLLMALPIFKRLGLADKIRETGIVKYGAEFTSDYHGGAERYKQFCAGRAEAFSARPTGAVRPLPARGSRVGENPRNFLFQGPPASSGMKAATRMIWSSRRAKSAATSRLCWKRNVIGRAGGDHFTDNMAMMKIYLRDPRFFPVIKEEWENKLGWKGPASCLLGDICRREPLLEIEGVWVARF